MRIAVLVPAVLLTFAPLLAARAQVRILAGPSPIPGASARASGDLTIVNEKLAFALAVDSPAPYGVPRGAIVAIAPVTQGDIGHNCVVFADFIPNNWSAWPNTFHRVEVLERRPQQVQIRTVRDFGAATVTTLYTLAAGSDSIAITTTMRNGGDQPLRDLLSGLTLWPSRGFLFPVPGLEGVTAGKADGALADRVVAYDAGWSVTLHAPYFDHVGDDSRDLYLLHTLEPGQSRTFTGWLQVGASGDLAPVVQAEIARRQLPAATLRGTVATVDGKQLADPVIVAERDGKPYAWVLGHQGAYRMTLPAGDYTLYATGRSYARSKAAILRLAAGGQSVHDFRDLANPGQLEFQVTGADGKPLDARLAISEGEKPLVGFLGRTTFFTELERKGHAQMSIAPGAYTFTVSSGAGFLGKSTAARVSVAPGKLRSEPVTVTRLFDPPARGWYAADLHHHADQAEAVTPPEYVARSELAAGLDVLFVSDHDSTANTEALAAIAAARHVPFVPGVELSPSWGHFNAYPLAAGAALEVDTSTASVEAIFAEARRLGAAVVQVNHPFIPYGYFTSVDAGVAPGGFNPAFDLIEINSNVSGDDAKVLKRVWSYWNAGRHYYLSAGSDTHDVWKEESGRVRAYAHPDGPLSATTFVEALRKGQSYVTYGPLIFPATMPGSEIAGRLGESFTLAFELAAVAGLKQAEL
ncbi:MAG: PHP domain-containing protein, partial [Gammaproteobacteria bacterium]|nr:PHP domain-containing protein [Gammaproteobacteria bacterium]